MTPPFDGERVIPLKAVMRLPFLKTRPTYLRVWRWRKYGIRGIKLESRREGRMILTSIEAVERFIARTNGDAE